MSCAVKLARRMAPLNKMILQAHEGSEDSDRTSLYCVLRTMLLKFRVKFCYRSCHRHGSVCALFIHNSVESFLCSSLQILDPRTVMTFLDHSLLTKAAHSSSLKTSTATL